MKLNTDANLFEREVRKAKVSGNIDDPEGGSDALMQVIVCHEEIGWRNQSHRIVVFSTDAEFHYAGDGKLGGIVKPNDGKCHMENHEYTHSLIQDYPSAAHINAEAKKNSINLIFAVTQTVINAYKRLAKAIEGSSASELENGSGNVVKLIGDQYSVSDLTIRTPISNIQLF